MISNGEYMKALKIVANYRIQELKRRIESKRNHLSEIERHEKIKEIIPVLIEKYEIHPNRRIENAFRRMAIMWWMRMNTIFTIRDIAKFFGNYDHSTVIHAVKSHEKFTEINDKLYLVTVSSVLKDLEHLSRKHGNKR